MIGENQKWQKIKISDESAVEKYLRENEKMYVSACGRFITRSFLKEPVWVLKGKNKEIIALILNSKSTIIPVLCKNMDIPAPGFLGGFFIKKKIHSVQGLTDEVVLMEKYLKQTGREIKDVYDYDLMSLDKSPKKEGFLSGPSNLILKVPQFTDLDEIAPLQAAYEIEEVVPKGSVFSPAASRVNLANIIANRYILAAEFNGRFIGKINVSSISFTKFLVGGVYVHPDFRGFGIARRMAAVFIGSLIDQGKGVTLFVKKGNIAACRLYSSLGFAVNGDYRITYY